MSSFPMSQLHEPVLRWYDEHARELPWRGPQASPWSVMISEFMLQQTPVSRVLPVHQQWLERWPTADRTSRLVFITRGISRPWIEALLAAIEAEVQSISGIEA